MVQFNPPDFIKGLKASIMTRNRQNQVVTLLIEKIRQLELKLAAFNALPDHVHLLVGIEDSVLLDNHIGQINGSTSFHFKKKIYHRRRLLGSKVSSKMVGDS